MSSMPTNLKIYDGSTDPDDHITHFVGAVNQGEWEMPVWCRMFQQTLDGPARGWFDRMPNGCIDSWADLCEKFAERFALRRKCSKDPTEVSKIIRRANEMLPDFKERWTEEMGYIQGVPEVMQISAFMRNSKCPELARRFADRVPQIVTEMMKRVDDFIKFEEAYKSTELPKGEHLERGHRTPYKGSRPSRIMQGEDPPKTDGYNAYNRRDHYQPYVSPRQQGRREKGHYTNDCYQLKRQLEAALKSRKLNHLVKEVRQRGSNRRRQSGNNSTNGKVINMVYVRGECQKRKFQKKKEEDWINAPITFPLILSDDMSDEPLIIEVEVEGYLVQRVFVDQGATVQLLPLEKIKLKVMFDSEGLFRRTMMKFTIVQASSPYNIILGRTGMRELRTISSTTHAMMKFPTPRGIATLVPQTTAIFKCWQLEGK
ncbi:reverse transcriptase domain-containing protein [Tanacetum coccineum]